MKVSREFWVILAVLKFPNDSHFAVTNFVLKHRKSISNRWGDKHFAVTNFVLKPDIKAGEALLIRFCCNKFCIETIY